MRTLLKRMAVLSLCALLLSGCTQSSLTSSGEVMMGPGGTPLETEEPFDPNNRLPLIEEGETEPPTLFEWEQVEDEAMDIFHDEDFYPLTSKMTYEINEEETAFKLAWVLKNETTEEEAMEYATMLVQGFNDILAVQKKEYEFAVYHENFGNVWDDFGLTVQISKEDGTMMIDKTYAAGEAIDLKLPELSEGGPSSGPGFTSK